jgi:uroporphyrinogen-III synthase
VHRHAIYSTRAPEGLSTALAKHRGAPFVFFSPSAVEHFIAAGGEASRVVCVGKSTAAAWRGPSPLLATPETVKRVLRDNP